MRELLLLTLLLLVAGCSEDSDPKPVADTVSTSSTDAGCLSCHQVELDVHHRIDCTSCHDGNQRARTKAESHLGLVAAPAHPDHALKACGTCHQQLVEMVAGNDHYTLAGHVKAVRGAFGGHIDSPSASMIAASAEPQNELELVDDLLRRRCLRCHPSYRGDDFPAVARGLGCAACHFQPEQTASGLHHFQKYPGNSRCLSCHYGNHVGYDYLGRYEHDFNQEYRTPYAAAFDIVPPYGVEFHQLEADVHFRAGMVCIDCHGQQEVMGTAETLRCTVCHDPTSLLRSTHPAIINGPEGFVFVSPATGRTLALPQLRHPAHQAYEATATCQACHARWTFNDGTIHLLRIDHDDFYDFFRLSVDGSSEVKEIIESHIDFDGAWLDPVMTDKFSGDVLPGIWLKGYLERRWEEPLFIRDDDGRIAPARPILDLRLSWIDRDETIRFNNLRPQPTISLIQPYAPHTIGPAGLFYEERLRRFEIRELSVAPTP
ncbi:MAG: cytochrome c3 family protein [Desulfofustis sp.]|nr:cytochrome c3 family protein [Desulfofustis sp.]